MDFGKCQQFPSSYNMPCDERHECIVLLSLRSARVEVLLCVTPSSPYRDMVFYSRVPIIIAADVMGL
jgi:hypothetical protein